MDPARSARRRRGFGLPRTRWDGPRRGANLGGANLAPPHPRGWTLGERIVRAVNAGSPAPAGMDRTRPARRALPVGLPRTRGDGPPGGDRRLVSSRGSPAPAGMDPNNAVPLHTMHGLPRTRGDGPHHPGPVYTSRAAPPHPRGWTRSEEHTSELQSLMRISYAVFCLKKKKTRTS